MATAARRGGARAAQLARHELLLRPPTASWNPLAGPHLAASPPALEPVAGRHAFFLPANVKARPPELQLQLQLLTHAKWPQDSSIFFLSKVFNGTCS